MNSGSRSIPFDIDKAVLEGIEAVVPSPTSERLKLLQRLTVRMTHHLVHQRIFYGSQSLVVLDHDRMSHLISKLLFLGIVELFEVVGQLH